VLQLIVTLLQLAVADMNPDLTSKGSSSSLKILSFLFISLLILR